MSESIRFFPPSVSHFAWRPQLLYTATEHVPNSFTKSNPVESYWTILYAGSLNTVRQNLCRLRQTTLFHPDALQNPPDTAAIPAWGGQTYGGGNDIHYPSMIKWIKHADDTWEFDYTNFDKWVVLKLKIAVLLLKSLNAADFFNALPSLLVTESIKSNAVFIFDRSSKPM